MYDIRYNRNNECQLVVKDLAALVNNFSDLIGYNHRHVNQKEV